MLFYFNMPNTQEIPVCPSDSVLPLLPIATPLTGQIGPSAVSGAPAQQN